MNTTDNRLFLIKTEQRYNFTALKHVTMRLMSSWQRLRGSGVGPKSGPLYPHA